jgi:SAM-dependent methyltransferase
MAVLETTPSPGKGCTGSSALSFCYTGDELDSMAEARNYYSWILSYIGPFVGAKAVEVGAGVGTFAAALLRETDVSSLTLLEPADNLFPLLARRFSAEPRVRVVQGFLNNAAMPPEMDSLVSVNVMEHVADDAGFLRSAFASLAPGGRIIIFVPALPLLYGMLDENFGHHRRYTKAGLASKLTRHGFLLETLRYFNLPGVVSWFLAGTVLRRRTLRASDVRIYDRWVVPWLAKLERIWEPPFGQNLLAVARKPREGDCASH